MLWLLAFSSFSDALPASSGKEHQIQVGRKRELHGCAQRGFGRRGFCAYYRVSVQKLADLAYGEISMREVLNQVADFRELMRQRGGRPGPREF